MSTKLGLLSIVCVQLGPQSHSLYRVERWLRNRGFLSTTILNGDAVGTKVSVCHRQGGRESGVVVKRGSTVLSSEKKQIWWPKGNNSPSYYYTPSGKKGGKKWKKEKKSNDSNVEKSHKSACVSLML